MSKPTNAKKDQEHEKPKVVDRRSSVAETAPATDPTDEGSPEADPEPAPEPANLFRDAFDPFRGGLTHYAEAGRLTPMGGHVLVYGILPGDGTSLALEDKERNIGLGIFDARKAVAWEVRAVAPDVPAGAGVVPGMCAKHLSATAAPIDTGDKSCRWFLVHYTDLIVAFWPDEEVEVEDEETGDVTTVVRPRQPAGIPPPVPAAHHVVGAYPWHAAPQPGSKKAWQVVAGDGDVLCHGLSQEKAEMLTEAANRKAGFRGAFPGSVGGGVTVDAANAGPPSVLDGLDEVAAAQVQELIDRGFEEVAGEVADSFRRMARNAPEVERIAREHQKRTIDLGHLPEWARRQVIATQKTTGNQAALDLLAEIERDLGVGGGAEKKNGVVRLDPSASDGWRPPERSEALIAHDVPPAPVPQGFGVWNPHQAEPLASFRTPAEANLWGSKNLTPRGVDFVVRPLSDPPRFTSAAAVAGQQAAIAAMRAAPQPHATMEGYGLPPGGVASGWGQPMAPGAPGQAGWPTRLG